MALAHVVTTGYGTPAETAWVTISNLTTFTYTHSNKHVTVSDRPQSMMTLAQFRALVDEVTNWSARVTNIWGPPWTPTWPRVDRVRHTAAKSLLHGELAGYEYDAEVDIASGVVTLQPRVLLDLTWADFTGFIRAHDRWLVETGER